MVQFIHMQWLLMIFPFIKYPLHACRITKVTSLVYWLVAIFVYSMENLIYRVSCHCFLKLGVNDLWLFIGKSFADRAHKLELEHPDWRCFLLAALFATLWETKAKCCLEADCKQCAHSDPTF